VRAQYLSRACAGELIRACVRCVLNRLRLGVTWVRAFSFLGRFGRLCLLAPGVAGGYVARLEGGRLFLLAWAGVCCLCAWAGVALACWRVRVCVWLPGLSGLRDLLPPGKIPSFSRPGSVGPFRRPGGAGAGWIVGRACCRCRLSCVAAHVGGYACIVREEMPGGIMAWLWVCCLLWIVCRSAWENTEILQKNSPEKRPRKNFSKNFPLWGNGLHTKNFCKKGVDNRTEPCYSHGTTAARHRATQTQNGGTKP